MKIRTLALLLIPPLILAMALAAGLWSDRSARAELRWGIHETGRTAAIAVAEMAPLYAADPGALRVRLSRVTAHHQIRAALVVLPESGKATRVVAAGDSALAGAFLGEHRQALARSDTASVLDADVLDEDSLVWATAPLSWDRRRTADPSGGAVAVAVRTAPLLEPYLRLRRRYAVAFGLLIFLALGTAGAVARIVARPMAALGIQARGIAQDTAAAEAPAGLVREIQELSDTFYTMRSILSDAIVRGRRALMARPLPEETPARILRERDLADRTWQPAGWSIELRGVGEPDAGDVAGVVEFPGGWLAYAGRVAGTTPLERASRALAASSLLGALDAARDLSAEAERLAGRIPFTEFGWLAWSPAEELRGSLAPEPRAGRFYLVSHRAGPAAAAEGLPALFTHTPRPPDPERAAAILASVTNGVLLSITRPTEGSL